MLTPETQQQIRDAVDYIAQIVVRDPKTDLNPAKVTELVDQMDDEALQAFALAIFAMHMSTSAAFQRTVYKDIPNPLDMAACGLATSCLAEVLTILALHRPALFDREAAARRASYVVGEARRVSLTTAAGQIILPGD